jgi:hypothetical protein
MSEQPPEQPEGEGESVPDLEAILRSSQGISDGIDASITALAAVHARWRQAWTDTGTFTSEEAFELVRVLVARTAGGLGSLGLSWNCSGTGGPRRPGVTAEAGTRERARLH